jgi:hypothetical protein
MGLFGIPADERQQCLAYYEAGVAVIAFQGREAHSLWNRMKGVPHHAYGSRRLKTVRNAGNLRRYVQWEAE